MRVPDIMSYLKIPFSVIAGYFLISGNAGMSVLFMLLSLLMDADGTVARLLNQESEEGGKLDILTDIIYAVILALSFFIAGYVPLWWIISAAIISLPMAVLSINGKDVENKTLPEKTLTVASYLMAVPLVLVPEFSNWILISSLALLASGVGLTLLRLMK